MEYTNYFYLKINYITNLVIQSHINKNDADPEENRSQLKSSISMNVER